jgi:hypothetical protein
MAQLPAAQVRAGAASALGEPIGSDAIEELVGGT